MEVELIEKALKHDKYAIARLISVFEDSRPEAADRRAEILNILAAHPSGKRAFFPGFTGTPGAGKSSLIGEIALRMVTANESISAAVIAIDPSSEVSGGSLLGDRTRIRFPVNENRLFFRSQASDRQLGGVSRSTFSVCRLLYYLFDYVFLETVGIGQSEIEIQRIADRVYLVMQPLGGDQIQFMKAGIMEIPDVFVLNKCDAIEEAMRSYYALKASLEFARPGDETIPIIRTSTFTGEGLDILQNEITDSKARPYISMEQKEAYFFQNWIRDEYGRFGLQRFAKDFPETHGFLKKAGGFDQGQKDFRSYLLSPRE